MLLKRLYLLIHISFLLGFARFNTGEQLLGGASIALNWLLNEPRSIASVLEDFSITHQISKKLSNDDYLTNIVPISYDQTVLLIGQVPNEVLKLKAYQDASSFQNVKQVFNQITIRPPTKPWQRIQDIQLKFMIRGKLMLTNHLYNSRFQIHVENKEVFILGKASTEVANKVVAIIQNTPGVSQVIRLITVID